MLLQALCLIVSNKHNSSKTYAEALVPVAEGPVSMSDIAKAHFGLEGCASERHRRLLVWSGREQKKNESKYLKASLHVKSLRMLMRTALEK